MPSSAAADTHDTITILRHTSALMAKQWNADGTTTPYGDAKYFTLDQRQVDGIEALSALLSDLERDPLACIIRGGWVGDEAAQARDAAEWKPGRVRRTLAQFDDRPLHMLLIDVDGFEPLSCDPVLMPEVAIAEYVGTSLPPEFSGASCHWQLSNSAGRGESAGVLKAHLWWWLETPVTGEHLTAWARSGGGLGRGPLPVDVAVFRTVQIHYTAAPVMAEGVVDPVPVRSGFMEGLAYASGAVPLVISDEMLRAGGAGTGTQRHQVLRDVVNADPVAARLAELGLLLSQTPAGDFNITCPFADTHTGAGGETSTQYMPRNTRGFAKGNFKCLHSHCEGRSRGVWLARIGIVEDAPDADAFPEVKEDGRAVVVDNESPPPIELKGIPEAKHLCTDQANAVRIVNSFGRRVFVAAGRWHSWDGKRWVPDESDVYRYACQLSRIVRAEAAKMRAKVGPDVGANAKLIAVAEALDKWEVRCEMKATIEAAVGLARKMLTVDGGMLDRDPWLLNVRNGTVDLRTGVLRAHNPNDYITKIADAEYQADARCPMWESVLGQITLEGDAPTRPVAGFLQRWFGYCATGSTREQQFVVHYGNGSNGKSTILDMIAEVLGDYSGTAAPGLLMGGAKDRHPTEIADLFGRRMVTAHETGEGGVLREDFVKQATGGDRIKARFMHADFFEFAPTHKLQLLTNHKPVIRGQDVGIWRRVLLMPYLARFASREEVRAGRAHFVKDVGLLDRLMTEKSGVLAWIVRGAVSWVADGLQAPDSVLAASKDYQTEQDRIGQFINECCELGPQYAEPLTAGMGNGLYPAYVEWAKEGGTMPLSKNRFLTEIERAVPGFKMVERKTQTAAGRRLIRQICGIRVLMPD